MGLKLQTVAALKAQDNSIIRQRQIDRCQPLCEFEKKLGRVMRGVKFEPRNGTSSWVYRDTDFTAMGYIGYDDFQTSRYGDKMWAVFAPSISNGKYSDHTENYHMRMSRKLDTTVRHAKSYLTRVPLIKSASSYINDVSHKLNRVSYKLKGATRNAARDMGIELNDNTTNAHNAAMHELLQLHKRDHTWADPTFADKIQTYIDCRHAEELDHAKVTPALFVHMYEQFGGKFCDMIAITDVRPFTEYNADQYCTLQDRVPLDHVGEDVQHRIAALHMLETDDYVEEVGVKINNTAYLLHV